MTRGNDAAHQWHALRLAGKAVAAAMRLLPRRRRFRAALRLACAAQPFFRSTNAYRVQRRTKIDGAAEIAVYLVLNALTVNGAEFDPIAAIDGYDDFVRLCREGKGVLLVQPHAVLTHLPFRMFHDEGLEPIGVNADARMRIAGTKIPANLLVPSPTLLMTARSRLREGRLVCAMIDRAEHAGDRTVEIETANGTIIIATALLQVAVLCGAKVAFTEIHVEGWRIAGRILIPSSDTVEGLTREFADFVRSHIAARFGGASEAAVIAGRLEEAER
jgi:lauroyl/myristoyl acyltransferase